MGTADGAQGLVLTVEELLGRPLNDIEKKYAPKILYVKGSMRIPLPRPRVSIVGSRKASEEGLHAANRIASTLVKDGVVIVSGLAEGIDTSAHQAALESHGRTIAVIGTPLNKVFPAKNYQLQQEIMNNHLVISQFPIGHPTRPKDFVLRNRTMALISDATIIVEAGEFSGSLHQGWEALRLGRSLFIWKSILENKKLTWPRKMMQYGAMELSNPEDVLEVLPSDLQMPLFQ
ncbi:putative SMF family protein [Candidatus Nitrososphaera gargensis Ga9.2]|uniref:Putative SMF family protein n=1 Tax=Nitrososphaera gargensis (strain Ga9.2) TaxID=1237085 RepID=K0IK29_NITGG|nr:DNA-processing protein DprA [Candidatus Nitrososphaera gargensis]AFU58647.1 putative SMF family protein [Candidatus Nitrososphaera gargensis Ga9.2]